MEWTENKTKLLIEEVEKHPCLYNCMFVLAIYCLAIVQFYCARKLRHKLPQFIAVCVMDLTTVSFYQQHCVVGDKYDTILTGSQLSSPHGTNKILKCETKSIKCETKNKNV